ncbi:MAG: alpha/beta hydrolase [Planctomycetota bacterium]
MSERRRPTWWKRTRRLVVVVVAIYAVYVVLLTLGQNYAIFPGRVMALNRVSPPFGVEKWTMPAEGANGDVFAWWMPAAPPEVGPRPVVIFAHGNGEFAEHNFGLSQLYHARAVHVLIPEYRGYAGAVGSPSEATLSADMVRWYDRLVSRDDVDASRVIFHGRSIGGGVMAATARTREPAAMILESTFTSLESMAWGRGLPPFLLRSPMRTRKVVEQLDRPILFLHGTEDTLIPVSHAHRNLAAARDGRLDTRPAGHNDLAQDWPWYHGTILGFLTDTIFAAPAHTEGGE